MQTDRKISETVSIVGLQKVPYATRGEIPTPNLHMTDPRLTNTGGRHFSLLELKDLTRQLFSRPGR